MTQAQLAKRLGLIGYTTISHIECGNLLPSEKMVSNIASILNADEEHLLTIGGYYDEAKLRRMARQDPELTKGLRALTND
jgi:transcriptional regulator with XRE-family HTH domain